MRKNYFILSVALLILVFSFCVGISAFCVSRGDVAEAFKINDEVFLGGEPIGISIKAEGLIVVGECDVLTTNGPEVPQRDGEILVGDIIVASNNKKIANLKDLHDSLNTGESQRLSLKRGGDVRVVTIVPLKERLCSKFKLGLMVKEEVNGIGTLTFVSKNSVFASLGHRIVDKESGLSSELERGFIYDATISGCVRGIKGKAGELQGGFTKLSKPIGNISKNCCFGLYGTYGTSRTKTAIQIAKREEIKMGKAQIFTTISGSIPRLYEIEIVKSNQVFSKGEKSIVFSVVDERLLEKTGGIVQGMSGSPIIQNGKLVGAVTHVFVNDPTRGYGIDIATMLNETKQQSMFAIN